MQNKESLSLGVKITDAEIIEKLDILRLERGISTYSFIRDSIAEKLRREGYLQGRKEHEKIVREKKSDMDDLLDRLRKIMM